MKRRQRVRRELIDAVELHLEGRQFLRDLERLSIGRWFGGPFTMRDFYDAKERGEDVHAFIQRMMAEDCEWSCIFCDSVTCDGDCLLPDEDYYP